VAPAYGVSVAALRFLQCGRHEAGTLEPVHWSLGHYAARVLNGRRPLVNEDGNQTGGFGYAKDVARACRLALEKEGLTQSIFNIGSGKRYKRGDVAVQVAESLGRSDLTLIRSVFPGFSSLPSTSPFQPVAA
jgi:dTDP-L-rhamnose 4-epimerase